SRRGRRTLGAAGATPGNGTAYSRVSARSGLRAEHAMADRIGMAAQAAGQAVRFGFYLGLNRLVDWRTSALGRAATEKPRGPMPSQAELLRDLMNVLMRDAMAVRDGLYPPMSDEPP